jgi:hypothetical protein
MAQLGGGQNMTNMQKGAKEAKWRGRRIGCVRAGSVDDRRQVQGIPHVTTWATGIMKQLLSSRSVFLAWLPQSDASNRHHEATPICHVCFLGMVTPIRCEQHVSWVYWRMILLATSVVSAWLPQSHLSNKDQRAVILLQWMNIYQNRTTLLCNEFIDVSKDCTLKVLHVLFYFNMVETEHCTIFRE